MEICARSWRPSNLTWVPLLEAKEFGLVRNMLIAAVSEGYKYAGRIFFPP
jgi:hypothetical protein